MVGGGASLCGYSLAGASVVLRPPHAAVANAVGAACSQVSGMVDGIFDLGSTAASRAAVLQAAEQQATQRCVQAGVRPGSCWVAVLEEVPLGYLPGAVSRVRVKVIGDLDVASLGSASTSQAQQAEDSVAAAAGAAAELEELPQPPPPPQQQPAAASVTASSAPPDIAGWPPLEGRDEDPPPAALATWQPKLNAQGEWVLHAEDLHLLAIGCGLLGCGGGGSPSQALLKALMQLQR